jgi:YD repeat-containing protein
MSGGGGFAGQSFTYNAMLQLTGVSGGGRNMQYNYSPTQNNGKIVSETDLVSGETVSYTYDALNRLATAVSNSSSAPWGQAFTYDGFGNLTNVNVISGSAPGQFQAKYLDCLPELRPNSKQGASLRLRVQMQILRLRAFLGPGC